MAEMLTTQQAADFLDISVRHLSTVREAAKLTWKKKDGTNFYTKSSLQRFLKQREKEG